MAGYRNSEQIRKGYADTPAGQIHYAQAGDGPPLILLGGSLRSYRSFQRLMPLLSPHLRVLAVDVPGFGGSHAAPSPVTVPKLAECIILFLDALGIAKAHVFGLHAGNKLGAAMGGLWPDRIGRLILAGQSHSMVPDMDRRKALLQQFYQRYKTHFPADPAGSHLVREWLGAQQNLNAIWWPQDVLGGATVTVTQIEDAEARAIDWLQGWRAAVPAYEAVMAYDLERAYREIRVPTLVLEMLTKREASIAGQAERLCELIPGAVFEKLHEADGLTLEYRPAEFAAPILRFLRA